MSVREAASTHVRRIYIRKQRRVGRRSSSVPPFLPAEAKQDLFVPCRKCRGRRVKPYNDREFRHRASRKRDETSVLLNARQLAPKHGEQRGEGWVGARKQKQQKQQGIIERKKTQQGNGKHGYCTTRLRYGGSWWNAAKNASVKYISFARQAARVYARAREWKGGGRVVSCYAQCASNAGKTKQQKHTGRCETPAVRHRPRTREKMREKEAAA